MRREGRGGEEDGRGGEGKEKRKVTLSQSAFLGFLPHILVTYSLIFLTSSWALVLPQKKINMIQQFCPLLQHLPWHFWPFGSNFMPLSLNSHSSYWELSPGWLRPPVWPLRLGHSINRVMAACKNWSVEIWTTVGQQGIFVSTMFSLFLVERAYALSVT